MSKISIITINYNNLSGLKKTMASVINHTWKDFEYIVIDGGSTDGSVAFIESQKDTIDYWISEPDKGVYHAMNKGILKASGEYLLFLNSGDHFFNSKVLELNHKYLGDHDIIYFNLQVVDDTKGYIKEYPNKLSFSYFVKDTLPHPATFIRKTSFEKTGLYNEDFNIVSDWKFFMDSICRFNLSYIRIDNTLSTFYLGGMSSYPCNRIGIFNEKQKVLETDYSAYLQDLDAVFENKIIVTSFRKSRIIRLLVKLRILNKF